MIWSYSVKLGELYQYDGRIPGSLVTEPWHSHVALYLGEDSIHRDDGVIIVNHKFLVGSVERLVDKTFLRYLKEINNEN